MPRPPRVPLLPVLALLLTASRPAHAQPAPDYAGRRAAALTRLGARLLIAPAQAAFKLDEQPGFTQASDFYYLTGLADLTGAVLVLDGRARTSTLFVAAPNPVITRPRPGATIESAHALGLGAEPIDSLDAWLRNRLPGTPGVFVAPNDARGTVAMPLPMAGTVARWAAWLRGLGYSGDVTSSIAITRPLREVKDAFEVETLTRVGRASGEAMLAGMRALRPGATQRRVEVRVIDTCVAAGGRHSFWPWAMSGPHAEFTDLFNSFVDYDGHDRVMQAGDVVRVDVGCQLAHYMGDVGRTAPVSGTWTAGQREAWDLFIAGYRAGLARIRDGARAADVYAAALERIRQLQTSLRTPLGRRAADVLLAPDGTQAWEFHGVGLDDAEGLVDQLRAGMTVAYELMFAVDRQGFYLEDMLLVERDGYRLLTPGLPYTATEIERAMRRRQPPAR